MNPVKNPFSPGAGTPPPALVGRKPILDQVRIALARIKDGRSEKSILLVGLRGVQCLVAFELKADKFKPEYLGQLNFYLEALDRDVRKPNETPSIGVLLCKDKDKEVVEYALSRTLSPTMVAEYKTQLPDKKLLQEKLHEIFENKDVEDHLN